MPTHPAHAGHQHGVTLIGFVILLTVLAFFAYTAMKVVPAYYDYANVSKAMNTVASQEASGGSVDAGAIHRDLETQELSQYFDDDDINAKNISVVSSGDGGATVTLAYSRQIPWIYNIDFLISFKKSVNVKVAAN